MRNEFRRNNKKKKTVKILFVSFLVLLLIGGGYAYFVYRSLSGAVDTMHSPIERNKSDLRNKELNLNAKQPFSVLLMGVDERKNDKGRSDSLIVLTINPNNKSVKMLSIPRDTRVPIIGKGIEDKINHSYAFGGIEMTMKTVENYLNIPIDYFIQINMDGFKDIVNSVGGVTVENDLDFTYEGTHFAKGTLNLNGAEALKFSRMRYEDPRGDFGRQLRQREIIKAVINEGASVKSLWNYSDIFNALGKNIKTNLTFEEMVDIQKNYKSARHNIEQSTIKNGNGQKINGIYYYVVPENERKKLEMELKNQLELE
jgi:polyisoprenyl-teichoic acid--peptidoglycan teichoic acid transferase